MDNTVAFIVVIAIIALILFSAIFYDKQKEKKDKEDKIDQQKEANLNDIYHQQKRIATNTKYIFNLLLILTLLTFISSFINFLIKYSKVFAGLFFLPILALWK